LPLAELLLEKGKIVVAKSHRSKPFFGNTFALKGSFRFGATGRFNPARDAVTLEVGSFTQTILPAEVRRSNNQDDKWTFVGHKDGLSLLTLQRGNDGSWSFHALSGLVELGQLASSVRIRLVNTATHTDRYAHPVTESWI
jgi:hypothetical protein